MQNFDIAIIGAGITGVAVARALSRHDKRLRVVVFDKENDVAQHTSGRNSGVVHGGYNQVPGSQKAKFCVEGNQRLKEFCQTHGIAYKPIGVLVVAREVKEIETLEILHKRGAANGVEGLQLLEAKDIARLEPNALGLLALHAPTVAVTDSLRVVQVLRDEAVAQGVEFYFGYTVTGVCEARDGYVIFSGDHAIRARVLVNCAGLFADKIAHMLGVGTDFRILPFRGEYYAVKPAKENIVQRMIYPTPNLEFPFLGIHWTPTAFGKLKLGPNVVLAFGRESYSLCDVDVKETLSLGLRSPFWQLFRNYPEFKQYAWHFVQTALSKRAFLAEASTLVKGLELEDLVRGPKAGNRAQLVSKDGHLVEDITVEQSGRSLHVLNTVSPGFTCGIPFGEHLAQRIWNIHEAWT